TFKKSSETTNNNPRKRQRSVTSESVQNINKMTLNDKSNMKSLATLVWGSTGNAGVLLPFCNEYIREELKKWWLPKRFELVKWIFEKNGIQLVVLSTDISAESSKTGELAKDFTSQIAGAEEMLPKSFKNSKKEIYNRCLTAVEKEGIKREKKDLRALCLNAKNFNDTKLKWILKTSYDICNEVINDLLKGYSSNFAAKRKKFKMKFCSKKDSHQSITVLSKHW
ncbi:8443_t:CDS:2, partial [Funneliformis geosporum]